MRRLFSFRRKETPPETVTAKIEDAEFKIIAAPWKGTMVPIKVRKLDVTQVMACGNFSLIETKEYQAQKAQPTNWKTYCEYAEQTNKLVRAALVSPTYDQIFEAIGKKAFNEQARERFVEIKKMIASMPPGPYRKQLEHDNEATRVLWEFLLPPDFIAAVVNFALEADNPIIKSMTEDMLLELAILAERGHDNPSDHVDGHLTAFHRLDIDRQAAIIFTEWKINQSKKGSPKK